MPGFFLSITLTNQVVYLFPHEQLVNVQLFPQATLLCLEMSKGKEIY